MGAVGLNQLTSSNSMFVAPPKLATGYKLSQNATNQALRRDRHCPYPDNSGWLLAHSGSNTGAFQAYDDSNTLVWSVAHTDINASSNGWLGFLHWDTINDKIFVCVCVNNTRVYVASLNKTTGAITQEFDFAVTNIASSVTEHYNSFIRRGNNAGDWWIVGNNYTILVDDTGATVESEVIYNSIGSSYMNSDGVCFQYSYGGNTYDSGCRLFSKNHRKYLFADNIIDKAGFAGYLNSQPYVVGDKITFTNLAGTTSQNYGAVYFDRLDFDRWLTEYFEALGGVA